MDLLKKCNRDFPLYLFPAGWYRNYPSWGGVSTSLKRCRIIQKDSREAKPLLYTINTTLLHRIYICNMKTVSILTVRITELPLKGLFVGYGCLLMSFLRYKQLSICKCKTIWPQCNLKRCWSHFVVEVCHFCKTNDCFEPLSAIGQPNWATCCFIDLVEMFKPKSL